MPSMMNIGSLLLLVLFIYSIVGINLFGAAKFGGVNDSISEYSNF